MSEYTDYVKALNRRYSEQVTGIREQGVDIGADLELDRKKRKTRLAQQAAAAGDAEMGGVLGQAAMGTGIERASGENVAQLGREVSTSLAKAKEGYDTNMETARIAEAERKKQERKQKIAGYLSMGGQLAGAALNLVAPGVGSVVGGLIGMGTQVAASSMTGQTPSFDFSFIDDYQKLKTPKPDKTLTDNGVFGVDDISGEDYNYNQGQWTPDYGTTGAKT